MAHLLLVEDDVDLAESLAEVLRGQHDVRVAANGEEGLRLLEERIPDLVVLDVEMPVLDGPGMARRMLLRAAGHEQLPLVLLSGIPDLHLVARRVGTPYFLPKPSRIDPLLALVDRALRERAAPGARRALPPDCVGEKRASGAAPPAARMLQAARGDPPA